MSLPPELRSALVDDLDRLIRLHDRELDGETLRALQVGNSRPAWHWRRMARAANWPMQISLPR